MSNNQSTLNRTKSETLESLAQYTFPQVLSRQADLLGDDRIAIREKAYGIWQAYSWSEYLRYTMALAETTGYSIAARQSIDTSVLWNVSTDACFLGYDDVDGYD